MADLTQERAHGAIRTALRCVQGLQPDRLLWGNREAPWSRTERHYRLEMVDREDLGWYRNRAGDRMRVAEEIVVHLTHRMASDQERTESRAGLDAAAVIRRLLTDPELLLTTMRITVTGGPTTTVSDSGDHLETDITIRAEYDWALTGDGASVDTSTSTDGIIKQEETKKVST